MRYEQILRIEELSIPELAFLLVAERLLELHNLSNIQVTKIGMTSFAPVQRAAALLCN